MRRTRGLSTRLLAAICTLALLQLTVFVVLLVALSGVREADVQARTVARAALAASSTRVALAELEAAERGVAIAGARAPFVQEWQRSARALRAHLDELAHTVDAHALPAAPSLVAGVRAYLDGRAIPLVVTAMRDPALARRRIASAATERRTERIDTQLEGLVAQERTLHRTQRDRASRLARLAWIAGAVGIVATLVCALGFVAYVRRAILMPLRGVSDAARALAAGDLRARVPEHHGSGEVGELARTFDQMAASLADSRAALERQNAELEGHRAELVEAARSAREGTSVLRAVLDATPDAIALLDRDGAVLVDNPPMRAVHAAFGPHATAIDAHGTLVPLDDADARHERRDEITLLGTRRAFARYAAPVHDGSGQLIGRLVVLREITGQREAERAKEEFFALVSHELRTPLTAILGYVELLLAEDGATIADEHQRHLEVVERNAQRLLRLVGDLLFAAQIDHGSLLLEPRAVDLAELAHDAVEAVRPRAEGAGIALEARIDAVPPCLGDRDRLAQVLDNLVSNALKFTPPGGRVAVRLGREDGTVRLEVADTGAGIPPEDLPRLFDRFYRATNATARAVPGLGLGLTIVHAIVAGHGGSVDVDSSVGHGTTFTVVLPLRTTADGARPPAGRAAPAVPRYSPGGR